VLLGDDAIIVSSESGIPEGRAIYRSLRLFPDSIRELLDNNVLLSPVGDYTHKQNIEAPKREQDDAPLPIKAIFLIDPAATADVAVNRLEGWEACIAIVEQSFSLDPTDAGQAKERLAQASSLAASIPAYRLSYPRDYTHLHFVRDAILAATNDKDSNESAPDRL
jgi:hypothetical protein